MDYTGILNEKENQIVELEKKIQNLEERLRRASRREGELENEVVRLKTAIRVVSNPNVTREDIDRIAKASVDVSKYEEEISKYRGQLSSLSGLVKTQFGKLRSSGARIDHESEIERLIGSTGVDIQIVNGVSQLIEYREKVVEVPIQDSRTKHLIHMLAVQMKKNFEKYPKLREECDSRLFEFFQQELIDVIEVDELERVVEIVKYVPEFIKVENVYAYSSEKSKRI